MKKNVLLFLLVLGVTFNAGGQDEAKSHRIVTKTRLQVLFGDLETQWLQALQKKDRAALSHFVSENLNVWTASPPGDPIPGDEWMEGSLARKLQSFQIRQIAVRGLSHEIAVANFILTETFEKGGQQQVESHFVVDVWMRNSDSDSDWRCTDRYWSEVRGRTPSSATKPDVKPTGKD